MQILKINSANLQQAVVYLKQGGVVIHPTDTCYGIAADITNSEAIAKVIKLKQVSSDKPMSILASDMDMLKKYGVLNPKSSKIAQKHLPGALTLLLLKTNQVPNFYAPQTNLIGIRIPADKLSRTIVTFLDNPITTTSANLTGKPQAYSLSTIKLYFENEDILVLDGGDLPFQKPSTICKIVEDEMEIIRQGDLILKD